MIEGRFDERGQLFFEIDLIAATGEIFPIDVLVDTGCTDWLAINDQDLDALGWSFKEQDTRLTAQGNFVFDIYQGKVRIDGEEFTIEVVVGAAFEEPLLGVPWLEQRRLVVDKQLGILTLG